MTDNGKRRSGVPLTLQQLLVILVLTEQVVWVMVT